MTPAANRTKTKTAKKAKTYRVHRRHIYKGQVVEVPDGVFLTHYVLQEAADRMGLDRKTLRRHIEVSREYVRHGWYLFVPRQMVDNFKTAKR